MITKPPRLDDVAARAGVSSATVSRYFNNPALLSAKTADRIREAVAEIAYVPNLLAGGLASSRSRLVAVLVPEIVQSIFNDTMEALVDALSDEGYMPMLGLTGADNARVDPLIDAALSRRVDAIILTAEPTDEALRRRLRASGTPVIETWGLPDDPIDVAVGFSHVAVGEETAQFVRDRGYQRPHLIVVDAARALQRRDGFVARWTKLDGPSHTESVVVLPGRFAHGRAAFKALAAMEPRPDVVICGSDWLAQAIIIEAQAAGLNVPNDLGVIGFGNLTMAGAMRPTITTIDVDGARIGREAVAVLAQRAAGGEVAERRIDVGFSLIARDSA